MDTNPSTTTDDAPPLANGAPDPFAQTLTIQPDASTADGNMITMAEIERVQQQWAEAIIDIGKAMTDGRDVEQVAREHIAKLYGYDHGKDVLFKPTLASDEPFRSDVESALSYFIGTAFGGQVAEDKGFATKPWTHVRFANDGVLIQSCSAQAMGHYYFTDKSGEETKVEYTFGYERGGPDDQLLITVHHSSLPFAGHSA